MDTIYATKFAYYSPSRASIYTDQNIREAIRYTRAWRDIQMCTSRYRNVYSPSSDLFGNAHDGQTFFTAIAHFNIFFFYFHFLTLFNIVLFERKSRRSWCIYIYRGRYKDELKRKQSEEIVNGSRARYIRITHSAELGRRNFGRSLVLYYYRFAACSIVRTQRYGIITTIERESSIQQQHPTTPIVRYTSACYVKRVIGERESVCVEYISCCSL